MTPAASRCTVVLASMALLACVASAPKPQPANVEGRALAVCGRSPMTGFARSGSCTSGPDDLSSHVVCAAVTQTFLDFTRSRGNDLVTPRPELDFAGLKAGDHWCLCALRWKEALEAGVAPPVVLEATQAHALDFVTLESLRKAAVTQ